MDADHQKRSPAPKSQQAEFTLEWQHRRYGLATFTSWHRVGSDKCHTDQNKFRRF